MFLLKHGLEITRGNSVLTHCCLNYHDLQFIVADWQLDILCLSLLSDSFLKET